MLGLSFFNNEYIIKLNNSKERVMYMPSCSPSGQSVQIRNTTDTILEDLYYKYHTHEGIRISKVQKKSKDKFFIITSNLEKNYDLTFFFKQDADRTFTFKDAVKKMTSKAPYAFFFIKVIEENGILELVEDPEAEKEYFEND